MTTTTPSRAKRLGRGLLGILGILCAVALVVGALVLPRIIANQSNQPTTASSPALGTPEHTDPPTPAGGADCSVPKFLDAGPHTLGALDQEDCEYAQQLDENGNYTVIPSYDGGVLTSADTSNNPLTPPTFDNDGVCDTPLNWYEYFYCDPSKTDARMADIKAKETQTGIKLEDALKWANDHQLRYAVTINIQVFGSGAATNEDQARDIASGLVGDAIAHNPQIEVLFNVDCTLINTSRRADGSLSDFRDCTDMVRVSLAPIYYVSASELDEVKNEAGHIHKYMFAEVAFVLKGAHSGVFVDCFNVWWINVKVWNCKDSSCKPPHENPVCPWNPHLPPDHPDCFKPKDTGSSGYLYPNGKGHVGKGSGGESDDGDASSGDGSGPGDEIDGDGSDGSDLDDQDGTGEVNDDDPGGF